MSDSNCPVPSAAERRIRRLVAPEEHGVPQAERVDWIHDPELQVSNLGEYAP